MISKLASFVGWLIFIGVYFLVVYYSAGFSPDWGTSTSAYVMMWLVCSALLTVFFEIGTRLVYVRMFRARSYGVHILIRTLSVLLGLFVVVLITRIVAYAMGNISAVEIFSSLFSRFFDLKALPVFAYIILAATVLSFIRQMSYMLGPQVLVNLMRGKYHNPREEDRVFMFLDMRGSTRIAEKLGHVKFSKLVQDCFHDLTDSAIKCQVEIYQYVGDEAILTWTLKKAVNNNNCIDVFWDFKQRIQDNADYYQQEYDLVPEFKAGINAGLVTVAEIGDIKRDIAYLSDVLNTAARIEGMCNHVGEDLLISQDVRDLLGDDRGLTYNSMGLIELKGRMQRMHVYSVHEQR